MNHQITTTLMDLDDDDDWEYLPDSFLLRPESPPLNVAVSFRSSSPSLFDMNYFSHPNLFVPLQFPPSPTRHANDVVNRLLLQTTQQQEQEDEALMTMMNNNNNTDAVSASTVSESADMNNFLDSSTSSPMATSPRRMTMQKISVLDGLFKEEEILRNQTKSIDDREDKPVVKGEVNWIGEGIIGDEYVMDDDAGLNLWKLGFGGIGAICSFGFAAATVCLIIFGGAGNRKAKQTHKLRFQIYGTDDQRMKQVVEQASKFNEAMSAAVRGVPLNRAHITYGGYYENSL